ncbi:MAG: hypothetical protein OXU61_07875 [Gammaproteobacteria bacterium]|nr:hypothetical protein [Gammaproteobacteria bacterium]
MTMESVQMGVSLGSAILNLVPVVVGGLLATLGGVVGSIVFHKQERRASNLRLKREKLEQLVDASYRVKFWLEEKRDGDLFGHEKNLGIFPISEVEMISRLYFPELREDVRQLSLVSISYQEWITEGRIKMLRNEEIGDDYKEGFDPIYEGLLLSISSLVNKSADLMNKIGGS